LKATSGYANQVETQTGIMTRNTELSERTQEIEEINRRRESFIKEMDKLIGPLYSRIKDTQIFNPTGTSGGRYWTDSRSHEIDKQRYEECAFWQEIAQYKYLAAPNLRPIIDEYLKIKLDQAGIMRWEDPKYTEPEKRLIDAVESRYSEIEAELSILETKFNRIAVLPSLEDAKAKS
jgi:flagellar capping protein FliD